MKLYIAIPFVLFAMLAQYILGSCFVKRNAEYERHKNEYI